MTTRIENGAQWFEWPALPGGSFAVVVFEGQRPAPAWGWEGTATRVRFGDVANVEEGAQTTLRELADRAGRPPRPSQDAEWTFVAFDPAGQIAGVRARGPL